MPEKLDKKESDLSLQKSKKEIIVEIFSRRLDELIVEYDLFFRREIKTPPEKKRDELERSIRQLLSQEDRSGRVKLLIENLAHRFYLYNNMWQKRVTAYEIDISQRNKRTLPAPDKTASPPKSFPQEASKQEPDSLQLKISLEDPASLDNFYQNYAKLLSNRKMQPGKKEVIVENLARKLKAANIKEAELQLKFEKDNLKIKIKVANT